MANIAPLMSSESEHYCTPPEVLGPVRRLLIPKGSGRTLLDPTSNAGSIVPAHGVADGITVDGLALNRRQAASTWYCNPPFGSKIRPWAEANHHWGREMAVPGVALYPARTDTAWCREHVFSSADAWVFVDGRLVFWRPIPLTKTEALDLGLKMDDGSLYHLRRWYPHAQPDDLPAPFRRAPSGLIVGPELGKNGKPQAAPFPTMLAFWGDPEAEEVDQALDIRALTELVRVAGPAVADAASAARVRGEAAIAEDLSQWEAEAERMLGTRAFTSADPLDLAPFEAIAAATPLAANRPHPVNVREFARHFLHFGTLCVRTGRHKGVYRAP